MSGPMVSVPVEPTEAMLKAAHAAILSDIPPDGESHYGPTISTHAIYRAYWAAMIAAAPPAESQPQGMEVAGFRYRIAPSDECRSRPWAGAGIVAEWGKPAPPDNSTIQYQTLYAPAVQIAAPGDPWPTTEADEAAMALAAEDMGNPAWWRGHDEACTILCQKVNAILDGKDTGRGVANDPWESTRRRLLALVAAPGDVERRATPSEELCKQIDSTIAHFATPLVDDDGDTLQLLDLIAHALGDETIGRAQELIGELSYEIAALRSQGQADAVELRGVRDTLIVAANNPVSHGGIGGLRELMLTQAHRITAALAQ